MKKVSIFILSVIILFMLSGCATQDQVDELQSQVENLQGQVQNLKYTIEDCNSDIESARSSARSSYNDMGDALDNLASCEY